MSCRFGYRRFSGWPPRCWTGSGRKGLALALLLCVLTPALNGCAGSAALIDGTTRLPPAPRTPGAIITDDYVCIPHEEAAELILWIERVEAL